MGQRRGLDLLGLDDTDLEDGGSERLVNGIIAHGDTDVVARRIRAQLDAGADHVAIEVLGDLTNAMADCVSSHRR